MREKETPVESKYQILHEHNRTDGSFKPLEELEIEYVELTDKLIHIMTEGTMVDVKGEYKNVIPTKVIFLDKSARPLAWLTRDLWDTLAPEPESDVIPTMPDFKFLNIDREHWQDTLDPHKTGRFDANLLPRDAIVGLRSIFGKDHTGSFTEDNELDDQVIMVIDEVKSTGATLDIATKIIQKAFPNSVVFGQHWMEKQYVIPGAVGNADLPVWYKSDKNDPKNEVGRGVGNRVDPKNITHPSQLFLSRRFPEVDQKSLQLRKDLKTLSAAVGSEVPYVPYLQRDEASREKRSEFINGKDLNSVEFARLAFRRAAQRK